MAKLRKALTLREMAFTIETVAHLGIPRLQIVNQRDCVKQMLIAANIIRLATPEQLKRALEMEEFECTPKVLKRQFE